MKLARPLFAALGWPPTLGVLGLMLVGCGPAAAVPGVALTAPKDAVYLGVETRLLSEDLVNFRVSMRGARNAADVLTYAQCAAAQYTLIRGFGFVRHVRTNLGETGGTWQADAVYTISPSLPRGLRTIDAEVTVADCIEQGIPTV